MNIDLLEKKYKVIHTIDYENNKNLSEWLHSSVWKKIFDALENNNLLYFSKDTDAMTFSIAEIKEEEYLKYDLEDKQKLVNGYIEYTIFPKITDPFEDAYFMLGNEEGRINGSYNNVIFDLFLNEFYRLGLKSSIIGKYLKMNGNIVFGKKETYDKLK